MTFGQFQPPIWTYIRLQNYTNMVVGKHIIQTLSVGDTIMLFTISIEQKNTIGDIK